MVPRCGMDSRRREKSLACTGIRSSDRQARSVGGVPTTLPSQVHLTSHCCFLLTHFKLAICKVPRTAYTHAHILPCKQNTVLLPRISAFERVKIDACCSIINRRYRMYTVVLTLIVYSFVRWYLMEV